MFNHSVGMWLSLVHGPGKEATLVLRLWIKWWRTLKTSNFLNVDLRAL